MTTEVFTFEDLLKAQTERKNDPIIMFFKEERNEECKKIIDKVETIASAYSDLLSILTIDCIPIAHKYKVDYAPYFILMVDGTVTDRFRGGDMDRLGIMISKGLRSILTFDENVFTDGVIYLN